MQSSLNDSSISVSDSVRCKQTEVNICTLNSSACVGFAAGCMLCYQCNVKLGIFFLSQLEASGLSCHTEEL